MIDENSDLWGGVHLIFKMFRFSCLEEVKEYEDDILRVSDGADSGEEGRGNSDLNVSFMLLKKFRRILKYISILFELFI
jgi:hypothetical protein